MSSDQSHICIVDDEELYRMAATAALTGPQFRISECASGEECLALFEAKAKDELPGLVLLDIEMCGMSGYEVCKRIRQMGHDDVQIIFVSGHDDLDCRLASFDAGGNDFIAKPFARKELIRKAVLATDTRRRYLQLAREKADAEEMSTVALESMDEMGAIQKLLRGILGCRSLSSLAALVMDSLSAYGCKSCVQLRSSTETVTWTHHGEASPLELSILDLTHNLERVFQFHSRVIINYERISIFITNMPDANDPLAGRIRDYGATFAEAADAGVEGISLRMEVVTRATEMQRLARESRDSIKLLREQSLHQQTRARHELEQMAERVEMMYYKLGLSTHQEDLISNTVRDTACNVLDLFNVGVEFDERFAHILSGLDEASQITVTGETPEIAATEVWL